MSITRIQNNQITDSTIVAYAKLQSGSLTGNLFAPTITLNSNVTINGNLFLSNTGNTTTINATNTYINDPLVVFNNGYTGSLSGYDIGMLVNRNLSALAPYGSAVNSAWVWVENDQAFESLITTDTGTGATSINNSGYANVKTGNTTMVSGSVTGTLTVTGATTLTTANVGGLQAVAIGNVTAGTGAFTTLGASGIVTITNATQNTGAGSGALQVTGGAYIGGNLYVAGNINASISGSSGVFLGNAGGQGALFAGISGGYLTEPMATFQTTANVNQYAGVVNGQNINKGPLASTDIFLSPDNGTNNDGYLDLGIASSTYNYPGFGLILPNDAYLFSWGNATTGGGNLIIGTGATNDIVFATGGINQNNTVMRITSGNVVAIKSTNSATNTTSGALQVAGGVGVQGAIYAGSIQNTPVGSTTASTGSFTSLNAASGLTASTVSAATIGNAGAALSGSTTTLTGLLTASAVNAATIGNAGANAQFGFVTATTVNAATIGNASTAGQFGTVTATTVNAATIGNTGAAVTGSTATFGGLQAAAIGNVTPGSGSFTTGTFSSTLGVTGATTLTTATTGGLQAVAIGNVTPGSGVFTGVQAGAIGNVTPGTAVFTTLTAQTETVGGLQAQAIGNVTPGTAVFTTETVGGLQAQAIGNVTPGTAVFTTETVGGLQAQAIGNVTPGTAVFSTLTVNSTSTYTGAASFTTATAGGLQAQAIGNVTPGTAAFTTETVGGLQAGAIGNITPGTGVFTTLTAQTETVGGLQAGAIGNVTPGTAVFTTETVGGLQAAAIGNVTPGTGAFTTVTGSSFQGIIGNATATTAFFTTANATNVYAATIGNVGTTLNGSLNGAGVTGTVATANVAYYDVITPLNNNQTYYLEFANVTSGNSLTGAVTTVNVNPSTSTISAGTFNGTSITLTGPDNNSSQYNSGALQIVGGAGISGNLYVAGNVYAGNLISTTTQILEVTDPLLYLNANTPSNYNYEIGFYSHFGPFGSTPYQHTGFVRDHTAGIWKLFANTPEPAGGTVNFANSTWEALQIGNLIVANTTAATGTTQATGGALYVAGGAGIAGALYAGSIQNTPVGSTTASTGSFTSLNAASGLTASTVQAATIGNAAASGQFGTVTATTVNAATIGNAGAALSGATTTLTGLLTASAVNAATIGNAAASGQFGTVTATNVYAATVGNAGANGQFGFVTATTVNAATIGNASASGQFGTVTATTVNAATVGNTSTNFSGSSITLTGLVTASTVNAATIGNAGAALSGATTTLTGLLTASAVNAATIGNAAATGQFGTVTATTVNAATIGNASASGQFGTVTATNVYGATVGNTSTNFSGSNITITGLVTANAVNAATIGNAAATGQFGTVTATTINAATIGNTGAQFSGNTATFAGNITAGNITTAGSNGNISGVNTVFATTLVGNLSAANVVGTVATANVAVYEQIIPLSNNQTYYIPFANVTNGNSTLGATSAIAANPSSGNVYATQFIGSGAYLTNINPSSIGQVATANASIYIGVNNNTSGGTYYPMLSGQSTTGNTQAQVNGSLSYVPNTGTLSATAFNGSGTSYIQTLQVNGQLSASGAIIAGSGVATTNNSTGALQVTGGTAITGNINVGGQMFVGAGAQATSLTGAIAVKRSTSTTGPGTQYTQDALINATNSGSSDFIAYANNYPGPSNDHGWMDMGFTGDAFSDPVYSITKANDGYLFASAANSTVGGNLVLSTDWTGSYNDIVIGVGSFYSNSEVARFHGNASTSGTFVLKLPTNATGAPTANTGAFQVWGGASFGGNVYHSGATVFNGSKTAGYDTIVKGASDNTLIWARPNATYDTVIIGNSATASTVVNGAKLNINTTDSILLPVGTNAQRPGSAGYSDVAGMLRYSSTANAIEWYTGSSWQTASTSFTVIADQQFTGTGSTPTFTLSTSQTTNSCIVSINGVLQIPTLAYSVSGTTLTFTENPANGDVIDVRMLTTTSTVTGIADTSGYNTVNVITGTGVTFTTGTVAQTTQYTIDTNGGFVTNGSNVTIASAGTSVVDNLFANSYSSAKYTITATLAGTNIREITEVLMVHTGNGAGAGSVYMSSYGRVNTAGNTLVTYSGSTSGNIAQLQATTTNANTILRIKRDYMAI